MSQPPSSAMPDASDKWTTESIRAVRRWSDTLFSFTLTRPAAFRFVAGQFGRIGFLQEDGTPLFRAYSMVSSPFADELEFFSIVVPDGAFTSRLQHFQPGDTLLLEKQAFGFLTLARFQEPVPRDLWLLATGTGIAPFLSILQDFTPWQQYNRIILAYSVRTLPDLAYEAEIRQLPETFGEGGAGLTFVPIVTRLENKTLPFLQQRLPVLIENGALEAAAGCPFNPTSSHILLCGNPQMVDDTRQALKARGLTMNRRGVGNIAVENYW